MVDSDSKTPELSEETEQCVDQNFNSKIEKILEETELPTSEKKERLISLVKAEFMTVHKGPLPDPETLRQYSEIIPNGADRVMKMAEDQLAHRIKIESKVIGSQTLESKLGQIFALIIGLSFLAGGVWVILEGHSVAGTILSTVDIVALVSVFIYGRQYQKRDLSKKKDN